MHAAFSGPTCGTCRHQRRFHTRHVIVEKAKTACSLCLCHKWAKREDVG